MLARMSIRSPASPSGASPALRVIATLAPPTLCVFAADLGHAFQPALAACIGLLLIGFPPARSRSRWLDAALLTLAMLPLLALLPMPEGAVPDWRAALAEELGIDLGPSFTPQPAALVAALAPFWTGLAWLWWTTGQQWDALESKVMTRVFVLAIAAIAATGAVWKLTRGGPLPGALAGGNAALLTRNQLATVLAIGASAGITMAFCAQLRRPAAAAFGITASLLCATALAVLGSRAGWLATGAGVAASLAAIGSIRHSRLPLIAAAVLLAGGAATIFLLPGETGERLRGSLGSDSGGGFRRPARRTRRGRRAALDRTRARKFRRRVPLSSRIVAKSLPCRTPRKRPPVVRRRGGRPCRGAVARCSSRARPGMDHRRENRAATNGIRRCRMRCRSSPACAWIARRSRALDVRMDFRRRSRWTGLWRSAPHSRRSASSGRGLAGSHRARGNLDCRVASFTR